MKLWGGRFKQKATKLVEEFTSSINFDNRLAKYDCIGTIAHIKMLAKAKIISGSESKKLVISLLKILSKIETGKFRFDKNSEDIHTNIQKELFKYAGKIAEVVHTARSRNDQVSLDLRMYLRDETKTIISSITELQTIFVDLAEKNIDIIMPGYTHLQHAQPILLSHHLMAYYFMLARDKNRFNCCLKRINIMPLGSCALAGTSFNIDRKYVAKLLGFPKISENSIDAVSDRDFVIEFIAASSIFMMHLSRLSEELILWASKEFNFIELPDTWTTGSSIMPQKKNPDVAELSRAKSGKVYGNLFAILTVMKGLPLSYNRDMQEDKENVFSTIDTVKSVLNIYLGMLPLVKFNKDIMRNAVYGDFSTATEVADYLVKKDMTFRLAHSLVGKIVLYCIKENKNLESLTIKEWNKFSKLFKADISQIVKPENSIYSKISEGSTGVIAVKKSISSAKSHLRSE
ncbi:MAG: argininosuccinate lyase [Candidatus Firestonebacteria bacterium]